MTEQAKPPYDHSDEQVTCVIDYRHDQAATVQLLSPERRPIIPRYGPKEERRP